MCYKVYYFIKIEAKLLLGKLFCDKNDQIHLILSVISEEHFQLVRSCLTVITVIFYH